MGSINLIYSYSRFNVQIVLSSPSVVLLPRMVAPILHSIISDSLERKLNTVIVLSAFLDH